MKADSVYLLNKIEKFRSDNNGNSKTSHPKQFIQESYKKKFESSLNIMYK